MKTYWDTSGLIRAYVMKQKPQGMTRSHTVSEFFCVLSGPGLAVTESGKTVNLKDFSRMTTLPMRTLKTVPAEYPPRRLPATCDNESNPVS